MSALDHSLPIRLVSASRDVRGSPKADIRFQRGICRDGPKGDMRPLPVVILEAEDQIGPELLECPNEVGVGTPKLIRVHHRRRP